MKLCSREIHIVQCDVNDQIQKIFIVGELTKISYETQYL